MAGSNDKTAGDHEAGRAPQPDPASNEASNQASDPASGQTEAPAQGKRSAKPAAEKPAKTGKGGKGDKAKSAVKAAPALIRTRIAQAVWLLCVLAALFLALGALVIALDFNQQNAAVEFVLNGAEQVDLGVFTRDEGIKQFQGENAATKNVLVNYGVGALFWIVAGRVADRFIRP